jgi:hypothetical protein
MQPSSKRTKQGQRSSKSKSTSARQREAIELDKATREWSSSVRTVPGGLPGLGKQH